MCTRFTVVVAVVAACAAIVAGVVPAEAQVTCTWTDNPIVSGETPIKAAHINEIRACIDRILGGSPPPPPPPPPPGQNITGTWQGTEDTFFLPWAWRFVITDNQGQLSGTYTLIDLAESGNVAGTRTGNSVTISLVSGRYTGDFRGVLAGAAITGTIRYQSPVASLGPYPLTLGRVQSRGGLIGADEVADDPQLQGRSGEFVELVKQCIGFSSAGELQQCSRSSEQEMIERYGPDWDQP